MFKAWHDGVRIAAQDVPGKSELVISEDAAEDGQTPTAMRISHIDPSALQRLKALAEKTYAPSSEHSRSKGAGAGELDND